jgi:cleavage and polyadenylation specificity factor subunit 4
LQCRFKHTRQAGPPPDPTLLEAAKPKDFRNINIVANQANENILPADMRTRRPLRLGGTPGQMFPALPGPPGSQQGAGQAGGYGGARPPPVDASLLASVGQRDLRYGF